MARLAGAFVEIASGKITVAERVGKLIASDKLIASEDDFLQTT